MPDTRKQRARRSAPSTPKASKSAEEASHSLPRAKPLNVPAAPPRATRLPAYFMAASLCFRVFLSPMWQLAHTAGALGRPAYPVNYTPNPVVCTVQGNSSMTAADGPKFCEHEVMLKDAGLVILSCDPNRGEWNTVMGPLNDPSGRGRLFAYNYAKQAAPEPIELVDFPANSDFHSLGIDYFADAEKTSLFVVNHQRTGPSIEVFTFDPAHPLLAKHRMTIPAHKDIKSANGITALGHNAFYVTNDHSWTRLMDGPLKAMTETFGSAILGRGWIAHVQWQDQGQLEYMRAYTGLPFPNGLAKGSNNTLFMSSSAGAVHVFQPANSSTPLLIQREFIPLGYALDNIAVTTETKDGKPSDVLVVGGHPNFAMLRQLAGNPHAARSELYSPSWITLARRRSLHQIEHPKEVAKRSGEKNKRYEPKHHKDWDLQTLFQDDGRYFGTSTGGSVDLARGVLIGTGLYETGFLRCEGIDKL
ncbi:hypothetical protein BCR37DRAFT_240059 [Protomyces lactucae-debilis]|uniref:Uncharacterized protein n=1 Tax=Protomyces lactucae-debilis TaxID=2754530 RepID=A0A1Y2FQA2_PROLT|nr:uncharacterized protein BCR37DRAFT_240059 [Protomyces lactucae-debilis]ORY85504.1 hypothetical protein BCR37DRAFT_240059 [Protomyces lactucae-debilis]